MNAINPKPTPSTTRTTTQNLKPQDPVIPSRSDDSFGRDAILPDDRTSLLYTKLESWDEVRHAWRAQIGAEQLVDVEIPYYRTPTETAPLGIHLRETDGAMLRRTGAPAIAFTTHGWKQLVGLLMQEVPNRPVRAAETIGWLSPSVRTLAFDDVKRRSRRSEGKGKEITLRSHVDRVSGLRALRAVVSGIHSGVHFDDLALSIVLDEQCAKSGPTLASVRRGVDETRGVLVFEQTDTEGVGVSYSLHFRNSETGCASLSFAGGCYIRALKAHVRHPDGTTTSRTVEVANENEATRRSHTLPRARQTFESRKAIADERMSVDVRNALQGARQLAQAWKVALKSFHRDFVPGNGILEVVGAEARAEIMLDTIESNSRGFTADDRAALKKVLVNNETLPQLPWGSAAYVGGAFAVLASEQGGHEAAQRYQELAALWITTGFRGTAIVGASRM